MRFGAIGMTAALIAAPAIAVAQPVVVTQDRATIVRLQQDADNVIIGNPAYFDVTIEEPRVLVLFGKELGQTNMIILDSSRKEILSTAVVVLPDRRNTSVHVYSPVRGGIGAAETTYTCGGRNCAQTKTGLVPTAVPSGSMPPEPLAPPPEPAPPPPQ